MSSRGMTPPCGRTGHDRSRPVACRGARLPAAVRKSYTTEHARARRPVADGARLRSAPASPSPAGKEDGSMLSSEENALLTRVEPGSPMGTTMRRYWIPALLAREVAEPDGPPVRVRLLGEDLIAFRDTRGRAGLLDEYCPHRRASLFYGRNEECGLRCVYHGWKYDADGRCVDMMNEPVDL